jgi:hypothetical protein
MMDPGMVGRRPLQQLEKVERQVMTGMMVKAKVRTDIKRNRIYITLPTSINTKELEKIYSEVRFGVADLKPGFDVVTDLTHCSIGHLSAIPTLRKITAYLVANKVGRVVRIVGNMSLILKQLINLASKFHCYKPVYVLTAEEAEEELKCPIKPEGIRFQLHDRQLDYQANGQKYTGSIFDISISGCAIIGQADHLIPGLEFPVTFRLGSKDGSLSTFDFQARVVRAHNDMFAVQFIGLDEAQKARLYDSLAYELNNSV